ncbi:Transposase [Pelosinus fermentans]|uniref:transposase n=1 Tax=Pelosinus fermentans TaxID=365349 RepID=UPI0002684F93|nr:transposase [Pelosinus fermentans]OAM96302.1 transposase IS3/IS911 family protein [Pelosinus fermentans DSM 17108]SDR38631.1 Transposase [Pelosinus fermentans]
MKTFDKEYKLMAVKRVKESGKPLAEVARELDLSPNTLHGWMSKFGKHGENAFSVVAICMMPMKNYANYAKKSSI